MCTYPQTREAEPAGAAGNLSCTCVVSARAAPSAREVHTIEKRNVYYYDFLLLLLL